MKHYNSQRLEVNVKFYFAQLNLRNSIVTNSNIIITSSNEL